VSIAQRLQESARGCLAVTEHYNVAQPLRKDLPSAQRGVVAAPASETPNVVAKALIELDRLGDVFDIDGIAEKIGRSGPDGRLDVSVTEHRVVENGDIVTVRA